MKRELDEKLCQRYPTLYRDRHGDPKATLMCWGFECGDGWYELIDSVSELLSAHNPDIKAVQVKEKFGTLRFYHDCVDRYSIAVESAAEAFSMLICEVCGAPAKRQQQNGWISTLCDEHAHDYCFDDESPLDLSRVDHFGLGAFWARMALTVLKICDWNTQQNDMPEAALDIQKVDNKLVVNIFGGNEFTKGLVDLFVAYANRVDEHSGLSRRQNE
jgi:hypothetical protein